MNVWIFPSRDFANINRLLTQGLAYCESSLLSGAREEFEKNRCIRLYHKTGSAFAQKRRIVPLRSFGTGSYPIPAFFVKLDPVRTQM